MFSFVFAAVLTLASPAEARSLARASQTEPARQPAQAEMEELRRRLDVLAQEIERLRSGEEEAELTEAERRTLAVAPSAAAVYRKRQGVSFAGYGEMLYERYDQSIESGARDPRAARLDFLRLILYSGYRFNERFLLNSEIELEHSNEASVEFAYVDFRLNDFATLRGGLVLLPMGLVNEFHEPTVFIGSRRPETETRILPSTWRENGFGLLGARGPVSYRAYVVNGLDAAGFNSDGLRGGRQKGARAQAADMAIVARADVTPTAGVFVGGSIYSGQSDQDQFMADGSPIDVATTIGEVHGQAQLRGLDVRALYARASLGGVAGLNAALGLTGDTGVGSAMSGGYTQVGYNVLNRRGTAVELTPFYRFERVNTHAEVPEGFLIDPSRKIEFQTLGLELRPVTGVVVKADYQWISNDARTGRNQFNVVLGYAF